jgi:outer membrane murein-binding lipoprotein Lpp
MFWSFMACGLKCLNYHLNFVIIIGMENQQLLNYIKQQIGAGVSSDKIKTALLGAGWVEADVNQAMSSLSPSKTPSVNMNPVQVSKPQSVSNSLNNSSAKPISSPIQPGVNQQIKTSPVMAKDMFKSKNEPVFQPKSSASVTNVVTATSVNSKDTKTNSLYNSPAGKKNLALMITSGLIITILVGATIYFFLQVSGLQSKVDALTTANNDLNSQIAQLTNQNSDLNSQISTLTSLNRDIESSLSFLVTAPGAESDPVSFSLTGKLGGSDKTNYTILTARGVTLTVKNSKDLKIQEAFKDLVGNDIVVSGTHTSGSRDVTITIINGKTL